MLRPAPAQLPQPRGACSVRPCLVLQPRVCPRSCAVTLPRVAFTDSPSLRGYAMLGPSTAFAASLRPSYYAVL
eukprot:10695320-Alexandrium_andersonii.AAC.1